MHLAKKLKFCVCTGYFGTFMAFSYEVYILAGGKKNSVIFVISMLASPEVCLLELHSFYAN